MEEIMDKGKKGTDKIISMYWFFILFIVTAAVVYMVALFYGASYDVRELEANALVNKLSGCVGQGGEINPLILRDDFFLFRECSFNLDTEDQFDEEGQYYISIEIFNYNFLGGPVKFLEEGNKNLLSACEFKEEKYEKFARCVGRRMYLTEGQNQYLVELKGVVRKTEKNV